MVTSINYLAAKYLWENPMGEYIHPALKLQWDDINFAKQNCESFERFFQVLHIFRELND